MNTPGPPLCAAAVPTDRRLRIGIFTLAYQLDQHGKYLLMAPGKDRSGMLGFRCVVDAG